MTPMTKRLLELLKQRGLSVVPGPPGSPPDTLLLTGPKEEKTPDIIDALKKFKPELLEMMKGWKDDGKEQRAGE